MAATLTELVGLTSIDVPLRAPTPRPLETLSFPLRRTPDLDGFIRERGR